MDFNSLIHYLGHWGRRTPATLGLHIALLLIIAGALVTHFLGIQGTVTLTTDAGSPATTYLDKESGRQREFPFAIMLNDSRVSYYPGTSAPMDYLSDITIIDNNTAAATGTVAMNHVFVYRHWRFYQTGMSGHSSTLTVAHDPWGIGITYTGYTVLAIAMILFFFQSGSVWRIMLRSYRAKTAIAIAAIMVPAMAEATPRVLQRPLAADFGRLWVSRDSRVELMQTFATDFTTKLCGSRSYDGLTPEQVLTGWLFYYDDWKQVPMIKVNSRKCRTLLGIDTDRATLTDFFDARGYKLEEAVRSDLNDKDLRKLDECVALISSVATGAAMRIYPCTLSDGRQEWLSWVDRHPASLSDQQWQFIVETHTQLFADISTGHNLAADTVIRQICDMQMSVLPPRMATVVHAERLLNSLRSHTMSAGATAVVAAILIFTFMSAMKSGRRKVIMSRLAVIFLVANGAYCLILLILRAIVGNHWPLSDGYETLLFLGALASFLGMCIRDESGIMKGGGLLISGCSLICAHITNSNPSVTPLLPVLASPWLAIHVTLVMGAYALMAFTAVAGVTGCLTRSKQTATQMMRLNYLLLLPAVFLLMAGIFTGAVWANQSWGRYWGWDPKETCALVTLIYYAIPLHRSLVRHMRMPRVFNAYIAAGIVVVLFTYFGANYLLPGLHSYATR